MSSEEASDHLYRMRCEFRATDIVFTG
uniref:Uncharacterized protein n=1 Tax=Arundo donax TaxID=35708 RepID=A0A0A9A015_ARUDO